MTTFQSSALLVTLVWVGLVGWRFRRSNPVLIGGLCVLGIYALAAWLFGLVGAGDLGLEAPSSTWITFAFALPWLALMLAYSPLADRVAARFSQQAPNLEAFRALQQSALKLALGIGVAWLLGGILEELVFRGIVLKSIESWLDGPLWATAAAGIAVCLAALGASVVHLYQGPKAAVIIFQLSVLFGVLFVVSGYNLWAVMLCHGLYDTIAFIRYANRSSRYSRPSFPISETGKSG